MVCYWVATKAQSTAGSRAVDGADRSAPLSVASRAARKAAMKDLMMVGSMVAK